MKTINRVLLFAFVFASAPCSILASQKKSIQVTTVSEAPKNTFSRQNPRRSKRIEIKELKKYNLTIISAPDRYIPELQKIADQSFACMKKMFFKTIKNPELKGYAKNAEGVFDYMQQGSYLKIEEDETDLFEKKLKTDACATPFGICIKKGSSKENIFISFRDVAKTVHETSHQFLLHHSIFTKQLSRDEKEFQAHSLTGKILHRMKQKGPLNYFIVDSLARIMKNQKWNPYSFAGINLLDSLCKNRTAKKELLGATKKLLLGEDKTNLTEKQIDWGLEIAENWQPVNNVMQAKKQLKKMLGS